MHPYTVRGDCITGGRVAGGGTEEKRPIGSNADGRWVKRALDLGVMVLPPSAGCLLFGFARGIFGSAAIDFRRAPPSSKEGGSICKG